MTVRTRALPLLLAAALAATGARAETPPPDGTTACKVMQASGLTFCKFGNRWIATTARAPDLAVGDPFPIYEQSMLMDSTATTCRRSTGRGAITGATA